MLNLNRMKWLAVVLVSALFTPGFVSAQFFPPGIRPGIHFNTPAGPVGFGFQFQRRYSFTWFNPYTGQLANARFAYQYAGPIGIDPFARAFSNNVNALYQRNLSSAYLSGGFSAPNPIVQQQLQQFAGAWNPQPDARNRGQNVVADQVAFERDARPRQAEDPAKAIQIEQGIANPTEEDIVAGTALNHLFEAIRGLREKNARAESPLLSGQLIERIRLSGSATADLQAVVREKKIDTPPVMDRPELVTTRDNLLRLAEPLLEPLAAAERSDQLAAERLASAVRKARNDHAALIRELDFDDAADLLRFLGLLEDIVKGAKEPGTVGLYKPSWYSVGVTVADLEMHIAKHNLTIAPAAPKDEDAYLALYQGVLGYYASLIRQKK